MAKNLPASAGKADLILGLGRLHVLSPCAATTEAVYLQPVVYNKRSHTRSPYTTTKYPHLLQLEKARVQQ